MLFSIIIKVVSFKVRIFDSVRVKRSGQAKAKVRVKF